MTGTEELIYQLGTLSYLGIFGISLLANMVIPVPEEVIILALGYLAGIGKLHGLILIPIIILGLLISDIVIYVLAKKGNRFITLIYRKFFAKRLEKRQQWIETHIGKVIFFSRFLVQLRFIGPFLAGQKRVPWRKFLVYNTTALVIYVPLYIFLGWYFQSRIRLIVEEIGVVRNIILIVVGALIAFSLFKFVYNKFFFEKD